ncbi:hypothetical protein [Streptomyces huiliensis]|uniref:hypothetical protein n=1 Tax=Streptomyces huiliensis TaxID=2876027 RepID=UPI001CBAC221|nr:hypothetical protein [Streptomyces huiliensis]MBZ4320580.1 hypothetical protein [Streptomyces huiliensis]
MDRANINAAGGRHRQSPFSVTALVSRERERGDGHMSGGGTEGLDILKTNDPGKSAAARALETDIQPDTGRAGTYADEATTAAVTGFTGWAAGSGLKDVADEWDRQVAALQNRLSADKSALRSARIEFRGQDLRTAGILDRFLPPSGDRGNG